MAKKTAIRRLAKIIPKSPELAKIDRHDDSIDIESTNTTSFHKEVLEDISLPPGLIEALETTDAENQIAADPSEEA